MAERLYKQEAAAQGLTLTSAVPALSGDEGLNYKELCEWYLARLRKNAFFPDLKMLTPKQLVAADNQLVDTIVRAHIRVDSRDPQRTQKMCLSIALPFCGMGALAAAFFSDGNAHLAQMIAAGITIFWILGAMFVRQSLAMNISFAGTIVALTLMADPVSFKENPPVPADVTTAVIIGATNCAALWLMYRYKVVLRLQAIEAKARRLFESLAPGETGSNIEFFEELIKLAAKALREALERETAIVQYSSQVVCCVDSQLNILAVNQVAQNLWGLNPLQLSGVSISETAIPSDRSKLLASFVSARTDQATQVCKVKTGGVATVDTYASWIIDWSNSSQCYFCVVDDVTSQTILELQKQHFVSMIGHDLKSPLTALGFLLEMLTMGAYGALNEKGKESVKLSTSSVARLMQMINQLLDLDRFENAGIKVMQEPTDLFTVAEEAVAMVQGDAEQHEVEIRLTGESAPILGDDLRLVQVMTNLLSNAIKYSSTKTLIEVTVSRTNGNRARVSVCDHGRGIPAEQLDTIFDRYQQVQRHDQYSGAGLGLAICKAIVLAHSGNIGANNRIHDSKVYGSEFWFEIQMREGIADDG
jgi:PAS domain S-box-containing protein